MGTDASGPLSHSALEYENMTHQALRALCGKGNTVREKKRVLAGKYKTKSKRELVAEFKAADAIEKCRQTSLREFMSKVPRPPKSPGRSTPRQQQTEGRKEYESATPNSTESQQSEKNKDLRRLAACWACAPWPGPGSGGTRASPWQRSMPCPLCDFETLFRTTPMLSQVVATHAPAPGSALCLFWYGGYFA